MSSFLQLPSSLQIAILAILGLVIGAFANWCIYSLAWFPRAISPWSKTPVGVPPRTWLDRVPVVGWLGLRREAAVHGSWFWIRPLVLEVLFAVGLVLLFRFEISGGLLPAAMRLPFAVKPLEEMLLWQFVAHAILVFGLWVSTFIDLDEQTIPDSITVPGALLGIAFAVFSPLPLLPAMTAEGLTFCSVTSPEKLPTFLQGSSGLAIACGIMLVWGISLVPALCTLRKGLRKGIAFYCATFFRGGYAYLLLTIVTLSCLALAGVYHYLPAAWPAVITSVIGLGFGGGLVWAVRIIGQVALQKEAMGFGDVTLMAMVGAFLGWQAALVIFFLSPVAALVVSLAQWMFSGRRDIAFGPYLSLASLMVIVGWDRVWNGFAREVFALGMLVPVLLGLVLLLMMGLLMLWRIIEQRFFASHQP